MSSGSLRRQGGEEAGGVLRVVDGMMEVCEVAAKSEV